MGQHGWSERELQRRARHRLAILEHAEEVTGSVAATCRYFGISRGEHLRFYPPGTPQFHALYSRRNDSESLHNQIKRRLTRLPAYRVKRQMLFILGISLLHNAATRAFALQRQGEPNPLDGTG